MFPKEYVLAAFIAVIVFYFIAKFITERAMQKNAEQTAEPTDNKKARQSHTAEDCAEGGCGMRAICNGKEEVTFDYYEDEELDRFKERDAEGYSDAEVAEFRDILLTLKGEEVAPWLNSLCARGVTLPKQLRDEAIALVKKNRHQ